MVEEKADVVIAGAGPVGLALAVELGMHGVACIVIERRDGALTVPRMSQVSTRAMEYCRRWGVAQAVRDAVWPPDHPQDFVYLDTLIGREFARLRIPSYAARGAPPFTPEASCACAQIYFDPILAGRAAGLPAVSLRYATRLEGFDQDADGVLVRAVHAFGDAPVAFRARYLVGCDGAASAVREALGIPLEGLGAIARSANVFFRSAELSGLHDKGWARFYRLFDEHGCWGELIAIDGIDLWRLTVFHDASGMTAADYLVKAAGRPFAWRVIDHSPWERRDFVAGSYGRGRVFLAGDSAHQCSPTGGLGMHTGIVEAGNLAWKLAAAVEGWAGPGLLASYEAECRPVARRYVDISTGSFERIMALPGADRAEKALAGDPGGAQALTVNEQPRTQICYEGSPICVADGAPPPPEIAGAFHASARPGTRAPHAWLAPGRSTLDLFGGGFAGLAFAGAGEGLAGLQSAAAAAGVPLTIHPVDDPGIADLYERRLVLVRPDGHVAWRGDDPPDDPARLIARVTGGARPAPA